VKQAFDSVARGILLFSWIRLGVPEDVAQYLLDLDISAEMVIKTPLSVLVENEYGYDGLKQHNFTFHPQQGTPQGGNEASLGYIGFSDILLTALSLTDTQDYPHLQLNDALTDTKPNAYVDDLNSVSSTLEGLQAKANVVSAFCCFFGIALNTKKFRAFHVNWGNHHGQATSTSIDIHLSGWSPVSVPLATDGSITHLGITRAATVMLTI